MDSKYTVVNSKYTVRNVYVKSVFTTAEVANMLYEKLTLEERLPGSPALSIDLDNNEIILEQRLSIIVK